ncbi:MAG: glycoside hydrolase family 9 protein [Bacteroidaceae bacterium]|nr:glycoside hydrolase family 9 protein [Bacteroidaceae bacterium]
MKKYLLTIALAAVAAALRAESWIRINQLGYLPKATKVAVLMSQESIALENAEVVDAFTGNVVQKIGGRRIKACGRLGKMQSTYRLDFSALQKPGTYRLRAAGAESPVFPVNGTVYYGTADFLLSYMREQRCGWNPVFGDSCHQWDAFITNHPTKNGQRLDVRGGWHDAGDCLQYTATSANAIYQMMAAYQQFPAAFGDVCQANGTRGSNGIPDVVDEIRWGLDWLNRMNPEKGELYNQIADDRDHVGMRRPHDDPADYGWGAGKGRPVYFCDGKPQQRGQFLNATEGVASTAGKFAADFALGSQILRPFDPTLAETIGRKAADAYAVGVEKPGCCQTVSVRSPYIYEERNWVDDMELGAAELYRMTGDAKYLADAVAYGRQETVTPWMGKDTARHYQWYPFMNMGHYQIAQLGDGHARKEFVAHMRAGIEAVWQRAQGTPFLYGIPSIWCSNNLTTAMLTQCILYRRLTGDRRYEEMEGALRDWLFGCNPWGVSMVVDLPLSGNYPRQAHQAIVKLALGTARGGLVDGPVYASIFNSLRGVYLAPDARGLSNNYEMFQPDNMVYHDNIHDYSTNEPTMDGTAALIFPLAAYAEEGRAQLRADADRNVYVNGGIVRTNPQLKRICLVFTAADRADGADYIIPTLRQKGVKGGFFFTGEFYEKFPQVIRRLVRDGHYVGSHSYGHLLYSTWENRDSMLVTQEEFQRDMLKSYALMRQFGISKEDAPFFIPPYEHYNELVSSWARRMGLRVINFTPGTGSNADYTIPSMKNYRSSQTLMDNLLRYEATQPGGLNGHFLMLHFGTHPDRTDKFYKHLPQLIDTLRQRGYQFVSVREALGMGR